MMSNVVVVDLACLSCGGARQMVVAALVELPRLPERCAACGGSVLAVGSTQRVVREEPKLDWDDGPRRGRPPKRPCSRPQGG
jgi:hypothetical protein